MYKMEISNGVVHKAPQDLKKALILDSQALEVWEDLTPLARNEWICWIVSVKKSETSEKHIKRTIEGLKKGKRRPCCWAGCTHR